VIKIIDICNHLPKHRVEYHRNGIALLPETSDPDPGMAILVIYEQMHMTSLSCNCRAYKAKKNCPHKSELSGVINLFIDRPDKDGFDAAFRKGPWYRLAEVLNQACHVETEYLKIGTATDADAQSNAVCVFRGDDLLVTYYPDHRVEKASGIDEEALFVQRSGLVPSASNPFHRGHAIEMLSALTRTESENILNEKNLKSRRQALEESFWCRLAYHCGNLTAQDIVELEIRIEKDGVCIVSCGDGQNRIFEFFVPHDKVFNVLRALDGHQTDENPIKLLPKSLESILKVSADENNDLHVSLFLVLHLPDGTTETIERRRLKSFWYGDYVYVPWHNILTTWRKPDHLWEKFSGRYQKTLRRDRIPQILENIEDFFSPPNIIDERVAQLAIFRDISRVVITPSAEDRDWCWLSVEYGFGENGAVSLTDIYQAKLSGKRYLSVAGGWVDTRAIDLETVLGGADNSLTRQLAGSKTQIQLSRANLLRLQAATGKALEIREETQTDCAGIRTLLNMVPALPVKGLDGFASVLREYQHKGLEWMTFLFENGFGGLLCDEMGLGKTHQVMGLMVWLMKVKKERFPFLVICPTTVISHWERKITEYAPALHPIVYHGTDRELTNGNAPGTVLITSYGILMRDIRRLSKINFSLAAFDEAQFIKNTATKTYAAALDLNAIMKIAVTGTPIENRLGDLKALMDLTVPGYLGSDNFFVHRYESEGVNRLKELRQLVGPFTMRRTKNVVLAELPEKIEDIRYCLLTVSQVRLYRDAVDTRRTGLLRALDQEDEAIPYIHIFALLTLLKQICNHPASISKEGFDPGIGPLDSGKWEVFEELVDTCLENGQKIVVFSQFVKMIEIIIQHLKNKAIGFACITGQTRNRGREIDRFNEDDDCRVFVGSLKAGGSGIDLIAGSVVIHYDRWWNAAKEDQATDRVHRIGQARGVQVFKLVTEGTLEEKISTIIDRKRKLMADVIKDDDPGTLKTFSREELIDLLSLPE
jgi:superfamily II DNA or RNA helicase